MAYIENSSEDECNRVEKKNKKQHMYTKPYIWLGYRVFQVSAVKAISFVMMYLEKLQIIPEDCL